jgi:hypothetical protein
MAAKKDPNRRSATAMDVSPSQASEVVAVSDTVDLTYITNRLWVGAAGNVRVLLRGDASPVTLVGVPAGTMLDLQVRRVYSTGTTVATPNTNIVALR